MRSSLASSRVMRTIPVRCASRSSAFEYKPPSGPVKRSSSSRRRSSSATSPASWACRRAASHASNESSVVTLVCIRRLRDRALLRGAVLTGDWLDDEEKRDEGQRDDGDRHHAKPLESVRGGPDAATRCDDGRGELRDQVRPSKDACPPARGRDIGEQDRCADVSEAPTQSHDQEIGRASCRAVEQDEEGT